MAPSADTFMARVTAATTPAPGLRVIELAAARNVDGHALHQRLAILRDGEVRLLCGFGLMA